MAGIGFVLRKLAAQDNFLGVIRAYTHSAVIAVGPWIMIVILIGFVTLLTTNYVGLVEVDEFLSVILYNFLFSFALSAPFYMISARYVADCLYSRDFKPIPGILITHLAFLQVLLVPLSFIFYIFYATMSPLSIILSVTNFILLVNIWTVMLYLECIRDFKGISFSWIIGTLLSLYLAIMLGRTHGANGMLLGINIGLVILVYTLLSQILAEYRFGYTFPDHYKLYFKKYARLGWGGFFLFSGMWIDKLLMWFSRDATMHHNHLSTFPAYDGGMFLSYLSIIPVMALFVFGIETNFYVSYIQYIKRIEYNAPFSAIEKEKRNIWSELMNNGRSFLILQGSITFIVILLASSIFEWLGIDFTQLGIFRFGALGAFFAALNLFTLIFLTYFDAQDYFLVIAAFMFFSNTILTLVFESFGFNYYGMGYCLSMIFTFMLGTSLLARFIDQLSYHIFITNIVKHQDVTKPIE